MTIRYEINPPKVSDPPSRIELLDERIEQISKFCDGIHVTDSVLGIERISPLLIGAEIKQKHPKHIRILFPANQDIANILGMTDLHSRIFFGSVGFQMLRFPDLQTSRFSGTHSQIPTWPLPPAHPGALALTWQCSVK